MTAAPLELALTIVLPDRTRQPISVAAEATAGRAAAVIARTLQVEGEPGGSWQLVVERTGLALGETLPLQAAGLRPDEVLLLAPAPRAETAAWPAAATPPPPAPAAYPAPTAYGAPAPTAARAAGWGAPPVPPGQSNRGLAIALVACLLVISVGIAVGATLLVTGSSEHNVADEPVAWTPPDDGLSGASPPPADNPTTDTETETSDPFDVTLTPLGGVSAYSIETPAGWKAVKLEEPQVSTAPTTRTRTQLVAPSGGLGIVIDELSNFDTPARRNRDDLAAAYATKYSSYTNAGVGTVSLPATTGYEWRYEMKNDDDTKLVRRVNVMFDLRGHSFAVRAQGPTDVDYQQLADLARSIARTVTVSGT